MAGDGRSYLDPVYDQIEAGLEGKYKLPPGLMRQIRTKGERSNADQVSPAGARSVYQIIPGTRQAFLKTYGIDAYASKEAAAEVAAIHLRDSIRRGKSVSGAIAEYHGGTDTANHGPITRSYVARATGALTTGVEKVKAFVGRKRRTTEELLGMRPNELGEIPKLFKDEKRALRTAMGGDIPAPAPVDTTAYVADGYANEAAAVRAQDKVNAVSAGDLAAAAWRTGLTQLSIDAADVALNGGKADPNWAKRYSVEGEKLEEGRSWDEVQRLRRAENETEFNMIREDIDEERAANEVLAAPGGTLTTIGMGIIDPASLIAGLGVGKVANLAGVGTKALVQAGRINAARVHGVGIDAAGALLATGAVDLTGNNQYLGDYILNAATTATLSTGLAFYRPGMKAVTGALERSADEVRIIRDQALTEARTDLGPNATEAQVVAQANQGELKRILTYRDVALAQAPADMRMFPGSSDDFARTDGEGIVHAATVQKHALNNKISDGAERNIAAEHVVRAEQFEAENPMGEAHKTVLAKAGQNSIQNVLLNSPSVVGRMISRVLLEDPTGSGGRRATASLTRSLMQSRYMQIIAGYDGDASLFRKASGRGAIAEFYNPTSRRQFRERVYDELNAREGKPDGASFDPDPNVVRAANRYESLYDAMRLDQIEVGTLGHENLPRTSRGYVSRMMSPSKVMALMQDHAALGRVVNVLSNHFVESLGWERAFSNKLAKQYLETAASRGMGSYGVPMNLRDPDAADVIREAAKAQGSSAEEVERIVSAFSRHGPTHTRGRLDLDINADIGNGQKLHDLFEKDVLMLARAQVARVSGELALTRYGIYGRKGLNVLRKSLEATGGTAEDMRAFDQLAAEFLNTPFGLAKHSRFLSNLNTATSAARLGGMGITQSAEYANALPALGLGRMAQAIADIPKLIKEVASLRKGEGLTNPILRSIDQLGNDVGLDSYQLTRVFDDPGNEIQSYNGESGTVVDRSIRGSGHAVMVASGHRIISAVQTRGMAEQIVRKAMGYIHAGKNDTALRQMGFTDELQAAVKADLDNIAVFRNGELVDLDLTKSKMTAWQVNEYIQSVHRGASQIIQRTYTGEVGPWAHNEYLKFLFKFRTFGVTAIEKQWGRNVNSYGALTSFGILTATASLAIPIHLARVGSKAAFMDDAEREEYFAQNLHPLAMTRAMLNYASASGLAGDVMDLGTNFAGDWLPGMGLPEGTLPRGGSAKSITGLVPGLGLTQDVYEGIRGRPAEALKVLPGYNLPYVQPFYALAGN